MDIPKIIAALDHTLLSPTATWADIQTLCDEAAEYGVASVCIPACYVRDAAVYLGEKTPVCTVIGFPNGNMSTGSKLFEAKTAIMDGAAEVDMVVNLGNVKEGRFDKVFSEISGVKAMIGEEHTLKVIVETCLLTDEEKVRLCIICAQAGADYIKTSTGFSTGGATPEDVQLLAQYAGPSLKIKAAGGIASLEDAQQFLDLGAHRLGTSKIISILKQRGVKGRNAPDRYTPNTL